MHYIRAIWKMMLFPPFSPVQHITIHFHRSTYEKLCWMILVLTIVGWLLQLIAWLISNFVALTLPRFILPFVLNICGHFGRDVHEYERCNSQSAPSIGNNSPIWMMRVYIPCSREDKKMRATHLKMTTVTATNNTNKARLDTNSLHSHE